MPKRTSAASIAVAAVLLLTLAGCAGTPESPAAEPTTPATTESAAPLTAEEPTPTDSAPDTEYLKLVRAGMQPDTVIPDASDDQLLDAGNTACDQMRAGTPVTDLRLIDGEQPNGLGTYVDSQNIGSSAMSSLCVDVQG
ncbi:DUF732 domain-containing protein [Microbacterium resistens]|uniref:DUF732 domain-containing protein n=1 Tax=Microbacterium resistens TaxID=156977 RepID=UPI003670A326